MTAPEASASPVVDREARERLQSLIDNVDAIVWEIDPRTSTVTFISHQAEAILGYPLQRWQDDANFWTSVVHPDDRGRLANMVLRVARGSEREEFTYRAVAADGRVVWLRNVVKIETGDDGLPTVMRGIAVDVSRERAVQQHRDAELGASEALSAAVSIDTGVPAVLEAIGRALQWSRGTAWVMEEATGRLRPAGSWGATDSPVPEPSSRLLDAAAATASPQWNEAERFVTVPFLSGDVTLGVAAFYGPDVAEPSPETMATLATVGGHVGQFIRRMRVEADLRFRQTLLDSQQEASIDGIVVVSPEGRILSHNQRFAELTGHVGARLVRSSALELLTGLMGGVESAEVSAWLEELRGAPMAEARREVVLADGSVMDVFTAPVVDASGVLYGRGWYFRDITEVKRSERRFAAIAGTLQRSLLPPHLPEIPGIELAARFEPVGDGNEVGGDFYDIFETGRNDWSVVIGDVCGKGEDAATMTALARYTIRAVAMQARKPAAVLAGLNEAVLRQADRNDRFITVGYTRLRLRPDAVSVSVSSAGHPLPLVLRADGSLRTIGRPGVALGIVADPRLTQDATRLRPGDTLIAFTDGLTDVRGEGRERFGYERLSAAIEQAAGATAEELAVHLEKVLATFRVGPPDDDIALLVARATSG